MAGFMQRVRPHQRGEGLFGVRAAAIEQADRTIEKGLRLPRVSPVLTVLSALTRHAIDSAKWPPIASATSIAWSAEATARPWSPRRQAISASIAGM